MCALVPDLDYEVLTTLPQGTQVNIVGIDPSGEWLQVELEGLTSLGWLYRDLVQVDCPLVNVRRITEREISLQPAAITQPYALYAYLRPGPRLRHRRHSPQRNLGQNHRHRRLPTDSLVPDRSTRP